MKTLRIALLAALTTLWGTSCMTLDMIAHAEGTTPPTSPNGRPYDPMPGYYALVPLVLPLDLITLPVQYFLLFNPIGRLPGSRVLRPRLRDITSRRPSATDVIRRRVRRRCADPAA